MWPQRSLLDLLGIDHPIIQAPMGGTSTPELAAAVSNAGGLGSVGFASLAFGQSTIEQIAEAAGRVRAQSNKPFNLNFFCHAQPQSDPNAENAWRARLDTYYTELGIASDIVTTA